MKFQDISTEQAEEISQIAKEGGGQKLRDYLESIGWSVMIPAPCDECGGKLVKRTCEDCGWESPQARAPF